MLAPKTSCEFSKAIKGKYHLFSATFFNNNGQSCLPSRPVHRCKFTADNIHVVSFSDDKSVALWDIPSETEIVKFAEHSVSVK